MQSTANSQKSLIWLFAVNYRKSPYKQTVSVNAWDRCVYNVHQTFWKGYQVLSHWFCVGPGTGSFFAKHVCKFFCIVHVGFVLSRSLITLFEKRLFLLLVKSSIFMCSAFASACFLHGLCLSIVLVAGFLLAVSTRTHNLCFQAEIRNMISLYSLLFLYAVGLPINHIGC